MRKFVRYAGNSSIYNEQQTINATMKKKRLAIPISKPDRRGIYNGFIVDKIQNDCGGDLVG